MVGKIVGIGVLVMVFSMTAFAATAINYSGKSTPELGHLRYKMRSAPPQERQLFEAEWQKRLRAMPPEVKKRHFPEEIRIQKRTQQQGNNNSLVIPPSV